MIYRVLFILIYLYNNDIIFLAAHFNLLYSAFALGIIYVILLSLMLFYFNLNVWKRRENLCIFSEVYWKL